MFCISILADFKDDTDADVYRKNKNEYKKIALTFDDGPHPKYTPKILEILDKYNIKATFFIIGINAHYYPDTLQKIADSGHEIGNHTYTHPQVSSITNNRLISEVDLCESEIYGLTEHKTKLFRPPEGMMDDSVLEALRELDYKIILWDIDTKDWAHNTPKSISNYVIENISSGDIILMHDYIPESPTPEALDLFLPVLIKNGYKFVTISELIGIK